MLGMIVIGVLALGIVLATRSGVREANSDLEASESRSYFDAVILQVAVALLDTSNPNRPRVDGVTQMMTVLGRRVQLSISSEFGKVDLNASSADTFSNLFEAAGEGPSEAAEEAARIINWRTGGSGDQNIRLFRVAAEITQVPDIDQDLYGRIAPAVTVYSGRGRVDESTAPLLALEAMPNMDHLSAEAIIRDRMTNQFGALQIGDVINGQLAPGLGFTGWAFTIDAGFSLGGDEEHGAAVIRLTGNPMQPYFMLWRGQKPE